MGQTQRIHSAKTCINKSETKHRSGGQNELVLGYGKVPKNNNEEEENDVEDEKEELIEGPVDYNRLSLCEKTSEQIGTEFVDAVSNGGSITNGHGVRHNEVYKHHFIDWLNTVYPCEGETNHSIVTTNLWENLIPVRFQEAFMNNNVEYDLIIMELANNWGSVEPFHIGLKCR